MKIAHHKPTRWRHPIFALVGLRPVTAQHSAVDEELLTNLAAEAQVIVEIGVAEGGSAIALRRSMPSSAQLCFVDPYITGRAPIAATRLVAHRLLRTSENGSVKWVRECSQEAGVQWQGPPVDLLFVDGDHRIEAVEADWLAWEPHLSPSAVVVFDEAGPTASKDEGPKQMIERRFDSASSSWRVTDEGMRYAAIRRR